MIFKRKSGAFVLIQVLLISLVFSFLILLLFQRVMWIQQKISFYYLNQKVFYLAEAGLETYKWQKKSNQIPAKPLIDLKSVSFNENYDNSSLQEKAYLGRLKEDSFFLFFGKEGKVCSVGVVGNSLKKTSVRRRLFYDGVNIYQ